MESVIGEFYEWESSFIDGIDKGDRYRDINAKMSALYIRFEETLTEEQKMMIKELSALNLRLRSEAERAGYKAGFKTGVSVAIESLAK